MDDSTLDDWHSVEALLPARWDLVIVPQRTAGGRLALLAGEAVYLQSNGESLQMNAPAGMMLAAVDGSASVRAIIDSVADANQISRAEVARFLPGAYDQFVQIGVLQAPAGASPEARPMTATIFGGHAPIDEPEPVGTFAVDGRPLPPVDT